jgi:hypothetical protein
LFKVGSNFVQKLPQANFAFAKFAVFSNLYFVLWDNVKNKKIFKEAKFTPNYTHKVLIQSIKPYSKFCFRKICPKIQNTHTKYRYIWKKIGFIILTPKTLIDFIFYLDYNYKKRNS